MCKRYSMIYMTYCKNNKLAKMKKPNFLMCTLILCMLCTMLNAQTNSPANLNQAGEVVLFEEVKSKLQAKGIAEEDYKAELKPMLMTSRRSVKDARKVKSLDQIFLEEDCDTKQTMLSDKNNSLPRKLKSTESSNVNVDSPQITPEKALEIAKEKTIKAIASMESRANLYKQNQNRSQKIHEYKVHEPTFYEDVNPNEKTPENE